MGGWCGNARQGTGMTTDEIKQPIINSLVFDVRWVETPAHVVWELEI